MLNLFASRCSGFALFSSFVRSGCFVAVILIMAAANVKAAVLFEDEFDGGFLGWTVVQPPGVYLGGPLRWEYDVVTGAFVERSNIYTDDANASPTAITPMLINDTVTGASFTYSARLTAGDDDGFGLIFGYQNPTNFYRVTFARQARATGYPWHAWVVERNINGSISRLFGYGTPGYAQTFVNAANVPFDVRINVDAQNRLTLTVTNNPTGAAATFPLVNAQTLPASAAGRVGMFTWGMSGGTPRGFRIGNLNLSPSALTGAAPLANWMPVIPPRANGSTALSGGIGQASWFLKMDKDGPLGTLEEDSDSLIGNDAAGQVDFSGPTLVAGNENWTNYVMAARILPHDDDGHGILLRYKNATNFYRIALRGQVSNIGVPTGLSIQKNVNRVYTEIYRDNPAGFIPVAGVPYDLVTKISNSTLNVWLISDPEGAAEVFEYGPFDVTGVDSGKIGLFNWGMSRTEFDWVSVQDGTALYVSSPHGSPTPPKGLNSFTAGMVVNASVGPATNSPGTRHSPIGWIGSGSVPASGTTTNVSFRIHSFSQLHWQWQTEYQLSVTNEPGGTISAPPGEWFIADTNLTIEAQSNPGFIFSGWSGDVQSTSPLLQLTMDRPYTLTANFSADSDGDALPDFWELAYFKNLDEAAEDDSDGDGETNLTEFQRGTHPAVADILKIASVSLQNNSSILTVTNNTGTRYQVERAISLPANWSTIGTTQYANTFTSGLPAGDQAYWRLAQPARPQEVPPFVPGSWTLAVLPDTQIYSQNFPELFKDQTRWIVANKERFNIKYVLHLGDIVNVQTPQQWENAKAAVSILDGRVPYALAPGNHDTFTDRTSMLNTYFPVSNYFSWPTFGGAMVNDQAENTYHLFNAGDVDWLILSLEWGPRNGVAEWASMIASNYPNHKKILITHAYMYFDDTRYDWATKGASQSWSPHASGTASHPDGTNDGEELWQKVVRKHPNFVMVFNGHVLNDGLGRLSSTNDYGHVVHQLLVNYQMKALGGEAFLRLVEFHPDGETVQIKAYSPYYGTYKTDPDNQFQLKLNPPLH